MGNLCRSMRGFTLIELLVVVLIIAILAAIALPQYQVAVEKSHAAEGMTYLDGLGKAEIMNQLARNTYTSDLSALDLEFSSLQNFSAPVISADANTFTGTITRDSSAYPYSLVLGIDNRGQVFKYCTGDERICKALGGGKYCGTNWTPWCFYDAPPPSDEPQPNPPPPEEQPEESPDEDSPSE